MLRSDVLTKVRSVPVSSALCTNQLTHNARTDLFVRDVVQPVLDKLKLVSSGGIELLGVYLYQFASSFERPPMTLYDLGSATAEDWQRFNSPSFAVQNTLPKSMQSSKMGAPIGNGQCMLLSLMLLLTNDCRWNENKAALWLRARAVFELIDNIRWYGELGGVEFVRDVLLSLLQSNKNRYGYDWPEHNALFVLANVVQRPIVVIEHQQRSTSTTTEQQRQRKTSRSQRNNDDLRHSERHCVFLPLRTIVDASIPPAARPTRLYLWHGNDDYVDQVANHYRPLSFADEQYVVHARHLTAKADELSTPFVENGWCETRESVFDALTGEPPPLFGERSFSVVLQHA